MPADPATAAAHLRRHGLPTAALRPVAAGTVNEVWRTAAHVLRMGPASDHAREARLALGALELGIRTARPVAWGEGYGVWERLPGRTAGEAGAVAPAAWRALLDDLERLHRSPLEPPPSAPRATWRTSSSRAGEERAPPRAGPRSTRPRPGGPVPDPSPSARGPIDFWVPPTP